MGKASKFGSDVEADKHVGQPASIAHGGNTYFHRKSAFIDISAGAGDSGKPIKLDSGGKIDSSMIPPVSCPKMEIDEGDTDVVRTRNLCTHYESGAQTGALVIDTELPWNQMTMYRLEIKGYDYTNKASLVDIQIGFYMYNDDLIYRASYINNGGKRVRVRVAKKDSASDIAIVIGTISTSWSYVTIMVSDLWQMYAGQDADHAEGWSISRKTALTGYSNIQEIREYSGSWMIGAIAPYFGGYFQDGSNGSFTVVMITANTIAAINAELNPSGKFACNGAALNDPDSLIFDGATRYLPNISDDRFLRGDTAIGSVGGANANSHTHAKGSFAVASHSHTLPNHRHTIAHRHASPSSNPNSRMCLKSGWGSISTTTNIYCGHGTGGATWTGNHYKTYDSDATYSGYYQGTLGSTAPGFSGTSATPSDTENQPKYVSTVYVMKVK